MGKELLFGMMEKFIKGISNKLKWKVRAKFIIHQGR